MDADYIAYCKRLFMRVAKSVCPDFQVPKDYKPILNDILLWCIMAPGKLDPQKGLWLCGNVGTGKSTLLEIVKLFCTIVRPIDESGFPYSFRTTNTIKVCAAFQKDGYEGIETYIDSHRQAFDELGSETIPTSHFGSSENVMQYILQRRYDNRFDSFTHVTANYSIADIRTIYSERIYDRCREMFNEVVITGKSFRK